MRSDLINPELFGNEAGEDEDLHILNSYFVEKPDFERFYSKDNRLAFVRSRKGVGKSTLLMKTLYSRNKADSDELRVYVKASDLIALQEHVNTSADGHIYGWQQRICTRINLELGSTLQVALTDDSVLLVESAELAGFRNRNIVSALVDRLKVKGLGAEIERNRVAVGNPQALLSRILSKKTDTTVWLFVDDIDATFVNTDHERLKASTFFSACRNLVRTVSGLCIRASVRADVWPILAQHDESLDKCEQYMLDLKWSTEETGRILQNKVHSYFTRYYPDDRKYTVLEPHRDGSRVMALVFKPFPRRDRTVEAFRPIHIISGGRPRWAAQLCKLAGRDAFDKHADKISWGHVRATLREYGKSRVSDLYKEHRHQCARIEDIIETFSGGPRRYTTDELLRHITDKIIRNRGLPHIDGITAEKGSVTVANFLYRIGFITARDESDVTGLGFIRFEDRPNLLSTTANLDDNLPWEIHPSYREVLRIKAGRTGPDSGDL